MVKENAPGQIGINKNFTITNLDGEELIYMVFTSSENYDHKGKYTGKGEAWYTINFLESGRKSIKTLQLQILFGRQIFLK